MALTGPYATEAEAIAVCTGSVPCDDEPCYDGPTGPLNGNPEIDIDLDGVTVKLTYGGGVWSGTEGGFTWELTCVAGVFTLYKKDGGGDVVKSGTAISQACDPAFELVFDSADMGTTADVTAVLTP